MMQRIATLALLACIGLGCDDMGLPNTREITAAPNTDIPSSALNVVQDCIVGGKHSEFENPIHAIGFQPVVGGAPAHQGNYDEPTGAGGTTWEASCPVRVGERVTKIRFRYRRSSGAGDCTMSYYGDSAVGAGTVIGTHVDAVHDHTDQVYDLVVNNVAAADNSYRISITIGDATGPGRFYSVSWFSDKL